MYKLFNFLFGWDYVFWQNTADQGIARVYVTKDGEVYYYRYKITKLIDIIPPPSKNMKFWEHRPLFLTCHASKYFKDL